MSAAQVLNGFCAELRRHGFERQATALGSLPDRSDPPPAAVPASRLPVLRHLDRAVALSEPTPLAGLAAAVGAWGSGVPWTRNPAYVHAPPDEQLLDGYGYATLALRPRPADGGSLRGTGVSAGVLLLGPGIRYPLHRHPAEEIYLPLTGARWASDDGPFRLVAAGEPLHHRPWQPHAMTTGQDPLLALYLWTGDVTTPAALC